MPKKGGKKGGKADGEPAKPKSELDGLSKEDLVAMVSQLRVEKYAGEQQVNQLSAALQRQENLTMELESAVAAIQSAHERELGLMYDESAISRAELEFKAKTTELENQRLKDEMASYIVMEEQNSNLKASLSEMHDKLRDANILHREEIDRLRESVMEHKNKLHKEFKLRLQEMSGALAEDKMMNGATTSGGGASTSPNNSKSPAMQANKRHDDNSSTSHISVFLAKHEELEKEHSKMRLEHGLAQQSMEIQTREMLQLKRELLESRERCGGLEQDLKGAQIERGVVEASAARTEEYENEIAQLKNELQLMRVKLTASMHSETLLKKKIQRNVGSTGGGQGMVASRPHSSAAQARTLPSVGGPHRSHSASTRDGSEDGRTQYMNMRKVYPKEARLVYGGGGVDTKKIWNSKADSMQQNSEEQGRARAATALGVRNEVSRESSGQYAQIHLPDGGGTLAPDYGIPSDGRRSAPPRLNKSGKRPSTGSRFFNG